MNDFSRQWEQTGDRVLEAVRRVGESAWYVLGKEVTGFEEKLADHLGRAHVAGCGNGLDAIEIGLRALGLESGQKVLTTPLTAFATSLAIRRAGGIPVFVDVDETGLLDLDLAADGLANDPTIRFVVPVHLFGQAIHLERLAELSSRFDLRIVEDCAQAIGARSGGQSVGCVGQVSSLSFYPTKNLGALGDGGAVMTDDAELDRRCRSLRDYGQTSKYVHDLAGMNSRLDEVQAAILSEAHLPRLADWTARRKSIAEAYLANIDNPAVEPLPAPTESESAWHLFPVAVDPNARDAFMAHLGELDIQSGIHYPKLVSDQRALLGSGATALGPLPRAEALSRSEVSLPIHPYLESVEVERVLAAVNAFRVS